MKPHKEGLFAQFEEEEEDSEGTWAISYGDMLTLLLAFFILFFSVDPGKAKESKLLDSLMSELTAVDSEITASKGEKLERGDQGEKGEKSQQGETGIGKDIAKDEKKGVESRAVKDLEAEVSKVADKVFIEFPEISFFSSGKIDVNRKGKKILEKFAKKYVPYSGKHVLNILGFTDPRPVRQLANRRFRDNLELSVLRSVAAQRILQKAGIPISRTRLGGYGVFHREFEKIKSSRKQEIIYAQSRKVVLVIEPEGQL